MKISVIVPVYNVEPYLEQCLYSIVEQTYPHLEIIVVNDGSTDHSASICNEFAIQDSRVKVIHQENGGVSSARNIGIKVATGDYITFVDSDDWLDKEMYQCMVESVALQKDTEVVMCDFVNEKKTNTENITADIDGGLYHKQDIVKKLYPTLLVTEDLGRLPIVSACICLFKKELLYECRIYFDESLRYAEDYLFMAKVMIYANSFYYLKGNFFYHYRQYELSRSKKYQPEWWNHFISLNEKLSKLVSDNNEYDFGRQIKLQLIHSALFISSAIFQDIGMKTKEKLILLRKLFNDSVLEASFNNLEFPKQRLGLPLVLYLVKYKMALGYWLFRKILK